MRILHIDANKRTLACWVVLLFGVVATLRGAEARRRGPIAGTFQTHCQAVPPHAATTTAIATRLRGGATAPGGKAPPKKGVITPPRGSTTNRKSQSLGGGTASIPNEVFNLVKAIVGVGVLSLPSGIAAFSGSKTALVPSVAIMTVIGLLSAYGFATIGRVCAYTGGTSYRQAWALSVGEKSSWIPAYSTTAKTFLACLAFSMVLKDTFTSLLRANNPTVVALGVTSCILLPLCLRKSLASLAAFSLLGVLGMIYTFGAMAWRFVDGSYSSSGTTSQLLLDTAEHLRPSFASVGSWTDVLHPKSLILVCMLSTAYMAHFNAPKFFLELKDNTLPRYHTVVYTSFGISIVLMAGMTAMGFLTFGASSSGLILNNYSPHDALIFASRLAVALSLVFSYPLAFQGCRDGVLDLFQVSSERRADDKFVNLTTVALLGILTALAVTLNDVGFVLAFGGATLGNLLTYVYPALMYCAINTKQGRNETLGVAVALASALLGIFMGAVGANMALQKK